VDDIQPAGNARRTPALYRPGRHAADLRQLTEAEGILWLWILSGIRLGGVLQIHLSSNGDHGQRAGASDQLVWVLLNRHSTASHGGYLCDPALWIAVWHQVYDTSWQP